MVKATWYGHATFSFTTAQGNVVLVDPWIATNPACPEALKQVERVDSLLITHGHGDHISDALPIIKQHNPTVVAVVELARWLDTQGAQDAIDLNIGGSETLPDGTRVTMTQAHHTAAVNLPGGEKVTSAAPVGFVISFVDGPRVYFAGDTDVFGDMQIIRELWQPDIAFLPIGDHYTMGPRGAALAVQYLGVKKVVPMHYGTFPILNGTPQLLREELDRRSLQDVEIVTFEPGETKQLP
jgi:L-ascorbate metabolism protein UlaG (beta-lactamase superfamily)